jgi:hypothetical protein
VTGVDPLAGYNHGEYRTYSREVKKLGKACDLCRRAATAYQAERRSRPGPGARDALDVKASGRALWRLARMYPAQFRALKSEELHRLETLDSRIDQP